MFTGVWLAFFFILNFLERLLLLFFIPYCVDNFFLSSFLGKDLLFYNICDTEIQWQN